MPTQPGDDGSPATETPQALGSPNTIRLIPQYLENNIARRMKLSSRNFIRGAFELLGILILRAAGLESATGNREFAQTQNSLVHRLKIIVPEILRGLGQSSEDMEGDAQPVLESVREDLRQLRSVVDQAATLCDTIASTSVWRLVVQTDRYTPQLKARRTAIDQALQSFFIKSKIPLYRFNPEIDGNWHSLHKNATDLILVICDAESGSAHLEDLQRGFEIVESKFAHKMTPNFAQRLEAQTRGADKKRTNEEDIPKMMLIEEFDAVLLVFSLRSGFDHIRTRVEHDRISVLPPSRIIQSTSSHSIDDDDVTALLPKVKIIVDVEDVSQYPVTFGGFADIYRGVTRIRLREKLDCALKVFRAAHGDRLFRRLSVEAFLWSSLDHPNVLPYLGMARLDSGRLCLVSPWKSFGNIRSFLDTNVNCDRRQLIRGIWKGLTYLHDHGIVHGDLKGANILVGEDFEPTLADFGLSRMLEEERGGYGTSTALAGTVAWKAPEQFVPERFSLGHHNCRTLSSDVYSFGMTIYEIMSGHIPFNGHGDIQIFRLVEKGRRPDRPDALTWQRGLTASLWLFVLQTWRQNPDERPGLSALEDALVLQPDMLLDDDESLEEPYHAYWASDDIDTALLY